MSIFDNFTDKMSNIFRIEKYGYANCKQTWQEITTRSDMLGLTFRDPGTYPLARGRILPPNLRNDYILTENKFECFVEDKRKWINYNQIFDIDIHCINDFMNIIVLGGEFDKSLPMTDQEEIEEIKPDPKTEEMGNRYFWSNIPLQMQPDYSKYWNIVSSHIKQNILSHVRPECRLDVRCIPKGTKFDYKTKRFRIELCVNSINNEQCYWFDINKILQSFGGVCRKKELSSSPTILFDLTISKNI